MEKQLDFKECLIESYQKKIDKYQKKINQFYQEIIKKCKQKDFLSNFDKTYIDHLNEIYQKKINQFYQEKINQFYQEKINEYQEMINKCKQKDFLSNFDKTYIDHLNVYKCNRSLNNFTDDEKMLIDLYILADDLKNIQDIIFNKLIFNYSDAFFNNTLRKASISKEGDIFIYRYECGEKYEEDKYQSEII